MGLTFDQVCIEKQKEIKRVVDFITEMVEVLKMPETLEEGSPEDRKEVLANLGRALGSLEDSKGWLDRAIEAYQGKK